MTTTQTPVTINVTLEIDIELYAFAAHAAELNGLAGPGPYIANALAMALDKAMPEPAGTSAAELAQPGPELQGAARTRPYVKVDILIARPDARMVVANYAEQAYLSACDMLHGLVASALMDAMAHYEDNGLVVGSDWRPDWLQQRLDLQRYDRDDWPF